MPKASTAAWPPDGGEMGALLRARDWSRTGWGPSEQWPASLKAVTGIMLDAPSPISVFYGDDHLLLYNDAWKALVEARHPEALGVPMREAYPEAWGSLGAVIADVLATGKTGQWEGHLLPGAGENAAPPVTLSISPILDEAGAAIGGIVRRSVEAALRESEERYRTLFSSIDEGFCVVQVDFDEAGRAADIRFLEVNPAFEEQTGLRGAAGKSLRSLAPRLEDTWYETYGRIARSGKPERFQNQAMALGRWFDLYAFPVGPPEEHTLGVLFRDITGRRRTEVAFRSAARRSRYRARLAEALRTLGDADEVKAHSAQLLGEHLQVNRALFAEVSEDGTTATVQADFYRHGATSLVGVHSIPGFGRMLGAALREGRTSVVEDIARAEVVEPEAREAYLALGIGAEVAVPLMRGDRLVAVFAVHQATPRTWTPGVVALIEETAERAWAAVERVRTEHALRKSEHRYRTLFEAMEEGFCVIEPIERAPEDPLDFRYVVANPAFAWQAGYADVEGRTLREVSGNSPEEWFETYQRVLETGDSVQFEAELNPSGRILGVRAFRVDGETGPNVAVVFADVTEQRRSERVLRDSEERLRRLADSMPQLVWTADSRGQVSYYNTRGSDYEGLRPTGDGRWGWKPVLHADDRRPTLEAWHAALASGEPYEMEHRIRLLDGTYRWHLTRAERAAFSDGEVLWYGTATDIHELKIADELKDRFLAIASHELRNPVGVIHGMAQQMRRSRERGVLSEERLDAYVDSLLRSSTYLAGLINDLMDVSRLQRGMLTLHRETCSLGGLVEEVGAADDWPARVVREIPGDLPAVHVDAQRIQQVISNLVENALKYSSDPDPVVIRARLTAAEPESREGNEGAGHPAGRDAVLIEVVDRGIGLPADAADVLFTPFGRAANVGLTAGLGMGLYVSREVVERHGGRLWAASEGEGRGTTMSLWLPTS